MQSANSAQTFKQFSLFLSVFLLIPDPPLPGSVGRPFGEVTKSENHSCASETITSSALAQEANKNKNQRVEEILRD